MQSNHSRQQELSWLYQIQVKRRLIPSTLSVSSFVIEGDIPSWLTRYRVDHQLWLLDLPWLGRRLRHQTECQLTPHQKLVAYHRRSNRSRIRRGLLPRYMLNSSIIIGNDDCTRLLISSALKHKDDWPLRWARRNILEYPFQCWGDQWLVAW